jgi:hypothetical protein
MSNYPAGFNHDDWFDDRPAPEPEEVDGEPEPLDEPEPDAFPREEP